MNNEFLKIASSPLMNLDHTYRYSGTKLVEAESLSQHIVDTIMMGLKVIDAINDIHPGYLDESKYVMKAVYHDLEESITGDVPRPLKYHDEHTLKSMKDVADEVAKSLFCKEFAAGDRIYEEWSLAKEDKEGYILKLVDMLVVANKVLKEVSLLNNYYMLRVAHEVSQYLDEHLDKIDEHEEDTQVRDYLWNLLYDAKMTMSDILSEHSGLIEDFDIYSQSMV